MNGWIIALIGLGALGIVFGVYTLVKRMQWFVGGFLRGLMRELASSSASGSEAAQPRSLSSLESVLLPQVRRDFPEYNSAVIAERVKRDAKTYYESGKEGRVLYGTGTAASFLQSFSAALPAHVKGGVLVHRVALCAYDSVSQDRMLTYQAAVRFIDTTDAVRERRLVLKYLAAFSNDPAGEIKTFNCPNCGAPLPIIGSKTCRYCGTALKTPAGLGWLLIDVREG